MRLARCRDVAIIRNINSYEKVVMNSSDIVLPLIPELYCSNIEISLAFYTQVLGFDIVYQRKEEGFAMLDRQGARMMLDEIDIASKKQRVWLSAPLERPFGRGINFQIQTSQIIALYETICLNKVKVFLPMEEKWYRTGNIEICHRQFIITDPDGYMLRFIELIDEQKLES